jgi:hypothetical protein
LSLATFAAVVDERDTESRGSGACFP